MEPNMEKPALPSSLIQDPSKLVKVELNVDDSSAYNAGVTIKEEPYDPSYDEFARTPQPQVDNALQPQTADSNSSFSRIQVKQECDQDNSALETGEHLLRVKIEPEAEPDAEMTDVEEEEEEDKELQQLDVGSEPEEECYEPEEASDEDEPRHKRIKMALHLKSLHKCMHCQKLFDEEELLNRHLYKVPHARPEEPHSCPKCGEYVKCRTHLWAHHLMHKGQMPHICKDCGMVFKTKEAILKHSLYKHTRGVHTCEMCQEKFESDLALVDHLLMQHAVSGENESFSNSSESKDDLLNYSLSHNDTKTFICKQCMQVFETMEILATHSCGLEQCSLCLMTFISKQQLQEHTILHNVKEGYKVCMECKKTLPAKRYHDHVKIHHRSMTSYCRSCNRIFPSESELELHDCSRSRKRNDMYICRQCNMQFDLMPELLSHWKTHKYKCDSCSKRFVTQERLSKHMKECAKSIGEASTSTELLAKQLIHSDEGEFHRKVVRREEMLKESISPDDNTNTYHCHTMPLKRKEDVPKESLSPNDDMFVCIQCTKSFDTRENLATHSCNLEQCNQCMMMFSSKQQLQEHTILHNIKEGYRVCMECKKTVPAKRYNDHLKYHNRRMTVNCKNCCRIFASESELELHKCSESKKRYLNKKKRHMYICKQCNLQFDSMPELLSHWKTHKYKCDSCSKKFVTQEMLSKHMKECTKSIGQASSSADLLAKQLIHSDEEDFHRKMVKREEMLKDSVSPDDKTVVCKLCTKAFDTISSFRAHKCDTEQCCLCLATLPSKQQLQDHIKLHNIIEEQKVCLECGVTFSLKSRGGQIRSKHKYWPCSCKKCNEILQGMSELVLHRCSREPSRENSGMYFCRECNLEFSSWSSVLRHWTVHQYKCGACTKKFLIQYMDAHESAPSTVDHSLSLPATQMTNTYKYHRHTMPLKRKDDVPNESLSPNDDTCVCTQCMKSFDTREDLAAHSCDLEQCSQCMMMFSSKQQLEEHMQLHNIDEGQKVCLECGKMFPAKRLYDHMRTHRGVPFACKKCCRVFGTRYEVKVHKCSEQNVGSKQEVYICDECNLQFNSWSDVISHWKTHEYMCSACSEKFMSHYMFLKHMKDCKGSSAETSSSSDPVVDQQADLFKCTHCTMVFKSKDTLSEHVKVHRKSCVQCTECSLEFESLSEMQAHRCNAHIYKCEKCVVTFTNRADFEKHSASVHNEAIHKCFKCGMRFTMMSELMQHSLEAHNSSTRPFECEECNKTFKTRKGLRVHLSIHRVQSCSFVCDLCDLQFSTHDDFSCHMKKKHVACALCNENFRDSSELFSHYEMKHGDRKEMVSETSAQGAVERAESLYDVHQVQPIKEEVDEVQTVAFSAAEQVLEGTPDLIRHERLKSVTQSDSSVSNVAKKNLRQYGRKANGFQAVPIHANVVVKQEKEDSYAIEHYADSVAASQSGFGDDKVKKNIRQYGRKANSNLMRKVKTEPEDVANENSLLWPQIDGAEEAESSDTEFILPD